MINKWKLAPNKIIAPAIFGLLVFIAGAWAGGFAGNRTDTDAISATEFNHGRVIDDAVFYNKDAMSLAQIEQFLREKGPACDTNGDKYDSRAVSAGVGTTRRDYAIYMAKNGSNYYHAPPYICVNNYYEDPATKKTSFDTGGQPFDGGISAAQIIYNAAQTYGINPQVILVTLKKEWSYTYTDEWPMRSDYNTVMGYGCPDTGPNGSANCSAKYYGFYNQINNAAWQFKQYRDFPENYNYRAGRTSSIGYNVPSRGCGYRDVYVENAATAALYNYTPYVPNDAALWAYPGTGDYCSTYGNRNFYMFFREWFGEAKISYQKMQTPRYMQLKRNLRKTSMVDLSDVDGELEAGRHILFSSKIDIGGKTYLRTDYDTGSGIDKGILLSDLDEINMEYEPMLTPRHMMAKHDLSKQHPTNMQLDNQRIAKWQVILFSEKITIAGVTFLRTAYDKNNNIDLAIPIASLEEITATAEPMLTPRALLISENNTCKVNPLNNSSSNQCFAKDTKIQFASKITVGDKTYLRSQYDTGNEEMLFIDMGKLKEALN
jgi:hypothetical protein